MKFRLLNAGLSALALLMTLSGCSSDEALTDGSNTASKSIRIKISGGVFTSVDNSGSKTRATDDGVTTSFGNGDAVGIFIVKSDGTVALTNAKYTYDGTSQWLNSAGTDNLPYYDGAKYFAYYPYQGSLSGSDYDATKATAETFFGALINGWTPSSDQSTQALYTSQDLMVSMATVDAPTSSCSFTMSHQMSMVEMDLHQAHYTYGGAGTYRFTFDSDNKPFNVAAGKYRLLVRPSSPLSVTGSNQYNSTDPTKVKAWKIADTAPAAAKCKIYKYNGASAWLTETARQNVYIGDVNIGDYLYDDGTSGTVFKPGSTVGIIYSDQLSEKQYVTDHLTHGKVLALKNANSGNKLYWSSAANSPYTTHTSTDHPYTQTLNANYNDTSNGYDALSANNSYVNTSTNYAWYSCTSYIDGTAKSFANSGWYLPSAGEWWDAMENLGTFTDAQKTTIKSSRASTVILGSTIINNMLENTYFRDLNTKLTAANGNIILPGSGPYIFWTSSEYNSTMSYYMLFSSAGIYLFNNNKTSVDGFSRAVLTY